MPKVLNIAQFVPVEGLRPDNDISLKTYSVLYDKYGISSEFVKPVGRVPKLLQNLKSSSKLVGDIFSRTDYIDKKYNIRVHFYKGTFPLINRVPFNTDFLLPVQYKYYNRALVNLAKSYKPDIIHAHSINPDAYYAYKLSEEFRIPYMLTLRGSYSTIYDTTWVKRILKNAVFISTPNFTLWSQLKKQCNIELFPHGIANSWFSGKKKIFYPEPLKLVTVSRLLKMKNIQIVLKAMSRLISDGYKITYDIVGDGEYRNNLEALAAKLGLSEFVRFHGFRDADYIRKVYENSDIFVMLSYPETFGLSYFEAAAQGLYIIGTRNTGAYGHFTPNEATFIDRDETQLVDVLRKIDKREFTEKTARMRSKIINFRNSIIIERYYSIIMNIIRSNKG